MVFRLFTLVSAKGLARWRCQDYPYLPFFTMTRVHGPQTKKTKCEDSARSPID